MKRLSLMALLLFRTAMADGLVTYIDKGTPAPYNGFLFNKEAELDNRKSLIDGEMYKQLSDLKDKKIDFLNKDISYANTQTELWKNQSDSLSKQLVDQRDSSFWKYALFFVLGCAVTTGIAFAVKGATR